MILAPQIVLEAFRCVTALRYAVQFIVMTMTLEDEWAVEFRWVFLWLLLGSMAGMLLTMLILLRPEDGE